MGNGLLVPHIALLFHSVEGSGKNYKYAELRTQICIFAMVQSSL